MKLDKQTHFKEFKYNGIVYDLSHLNAHTIIFTQKHIDKPERAYLFYVTYSMHCFAKDYDYLTDEQRNQLMYFADTESRPFCFKRYNLSKKYLRQIIEQLPTAKVGFAGYDNFATIEIVDDETNQKFYYKVTFVVYRFEKKLRLHITSAYPIDEWEKLKPIGFFVIANNILKNKKIRKL